MKTSRDQLEETSAGLQGVLPGAGKDVRGMLEQRTSARLVPNKPQAACDVGLFSDDAKQLDLF
jgi:hypothetical protein